MSRESADYTPENMPDSGYFTFSEATHHIGARKRDSMPTPAIEAGAVPDNDVAEELNQDSSYNLLDPTNEVGFILAGRRVLVRRGINGHAIARYKDAHPEDDEEHDLGATPEELSRNLKALRKVAGGDLSILI